MTNIDDAQGVPPATGVYAIADRLAQAFGASGARRCFFRTCLPEAAVAAG